MNTYDMWKRILMSGYIVRACHKSKPLFEDYTPMQLAFLEGAETLDTYDPHNMINAVGGRELPRKRKYYKPLGLKLPHR